MSILNQSRQAGNNQRQNLATAILENKETFNGIVRAHSSRLLLIALRITKSRETAEDIVQEAFLKLWQKRSVIIPENIGGWLYTVVSNLGYKHLQQESRQIQLLDALQIRRRGFYTDVEERLVNKENNEIYNDVFNRLPEKQRLVYQLNREEGLRRNEIARQLNISPNTVKVHLLRALQFMKAHAVSICLFIFFIVINNLFLPGSNTIPDPRDLYNRQHTGNKSLNGKAASQLLPGRSVSLMTYYRELFCPTQLELR
jgi:RNA polymerase sigma-70 factor (family 1)